MDSKYKTLLKDTAIFAIGNMGSKLILFLLVPLYTNCLTTEQYGIAELIFTLSQLLVPFLTVSIYESILRFGLNKETKQERVIFNGVVVLLFASITCIIITPLFRFYSVISGWRWYLCVYVISAAATSIFTAYLKVKNLNKLFAGISIIQTAILAVMNILLLALFHTGIQGYLVANIIAHFIAAVVAILCGGIVADLQKASFDKSLLLEMVTYSSPLIMNNISWWVIHSSDKIMTEAMIGAAALGLYTVATKIPSVINVLVTIFSQAWGISSIREYESTNDYKFYSNVFEMYNFITFGTAILVISFVKPFMNFFVGNDFKESWVFVPLLLISAVFSSISYFYGSLYAALKMSVGVMISTLIGAVINILLNFVGIKLFGIWGAVFGTVMAYMVISVVRMISVHRKIRVDVGYLRYLLNIVVSVIFAIVVSLDYGGVVISLIAILLFSLLNYRQMRKILLAILSHLFCKKIVSEN